MPQSLPDTCETLQPVGGPGEAAWDGCQSPDGQKEQGRHHTFSGVLLEVEKTLLAALF